MTEKRLPTSENVVDRKIASDWDAVQRRLAELNSRSGGDTRRQAILHRLRALKQVS